jgi:membrane associated rhomboid family serine protease
VCVCVYGLRLRWQVWRLATHHLAFMTSGELLLGGLVLYSFRLFERRYGTAKFAAFATVTAVLSTLFQVGILSVARSLGYPVAAGAPGPYVAFACVCARGRKLTPVAAPAPRYGLLCALLVPYLRDLPVTTSFEVGAFSVSYKWSVYLPMLQVRGILSNTPPAPSAC